ncbi:putative lipoprotein [Burkholderia sp. H160]|nr:putative lipoprotein [Burkholderia sp. H160]
MTSRRLNPSRPALGRACNTRAVLVCAAVFALGACAQPWQGDHAGEPESAVVARLGQPREVYNLSDGSRRLMWPTQPMGEVTIAADIDATGKVIRIRQVLQPNEFYRAEPGKWTRNDVLVNFGQPEDKAYFPLMKREVWSYRYLEDGVWYLLFNFYFDDTGVLRSTQKSPDPLHEQSGDHRPM